MLERTAELKRVLLLTALLSTIWSFTAWSDRRNYVWTYQYVTTPPGQTELEFYQTTKLNDPDVWEYRIEVEQGLSARADFSVYQIFEQTEGQAFNWDAVQVRTRYRFGDEGVWFLDPLLYFEYNRKIDSGAQNKFETKLVLAKTISRFNLAVNPVYEIFFAPGTDHEIGFDTGMSWEFRPSFVLGLESTTRVEFEDGETETGSYLGPTLSFASGKWWYTLGAAAGITGESDDARVRFLMGVGL